MILILAILIFTIDKLPFHYLQTFKEDIALVDQVVAFRSDINDVGSDFYYISEEMSEALLKEIGEAKPRGTKIEGLSLLLEENYRLSGSYITKRDMYTVHNFVDIYLYEDGTLYLHDKERDREYKVSLDKAFIQQLISNLIPRDY